MWDRPLRRAGRLPGTAPHTVRPATRARSQRADPPRAPRPPPGILDVTRRPAPELEVAALGAEHASDRGEGVAGRGTGGDGDVHSQGRHARDDGARRAPGTAARQPRPLRDTRSPASREAAQARPTAAANSPARPCAQASGSATVRRPPCAGGAQGQAATAPTARRTRRPLRRRNRDASRGCPPRRRGDGRWLRGRSGPGSGRGSARATNRPRPNLIQLPEADRVSNGPAPAGGGDELGGGHGPGGKDDQHVAGGSASDPGSSTSRSSDG